MDTKALSMFTQVGLGGCINSVDHALLLLTGGFPNHVVLWVAYGVFAKENIVTSKETEEKDKNSSKHTTYPWPICDLSDLYLLP